MIGAALLSARGLRRVASSMPAGQTAGWTVAFALLALAAPVVLTPGLAAASTAPVLSGYGSPGANVQTLLGVAQSNNDNAGKSGTAAAAQTPSDTTYATASAGSTSGGAANTSEPGDQATGAHAGAQNTAGSTSQNGGAGGTSGAASAPSATQAAVVAAEPWGLSGGDLVAVLAVALALLPVGLLTRFAARGRR
jgi:hypothetical protein